MKKLLVVIVMGLAYTAYHYLDGDIPESTPTAPESIVEQSSAADGSAAVRRAFEAKARNFQLAASGTVVKLLADDNEGLRHQRFLIKLDNGMTLLILHNIDLAERIADLKAGDPISFNGEYEWNKKGGLVHWTHHDPQGIHLAGWIKHDGRTYQ